ncbi:hypothetical protein GGQ87_002526 [Brevundimonas alba]|uniref:Uncharacterized protein n=1 Tax=Brevundimonas alba TaxID=74314 RepID=A0A7X6BQ53_9CAUL|nr:hypothetical protein [Brevundimonas alba]NJC42231.1 hypothetical protein [Brevundimonas alba]
MADAPTPAAWRIIMFAGLGDIVFGVGIAAAGLMGFLGEEGEIYAIVGGVMAVFGAGIIVWARNNLSKAESRRGDLN